MREPPSNLPREELKFYDLLSPSDKLQYDELRAILSSELRRNRRGKRLEGFAEILASVHSFCVRQDGSDWQRSLVCGVCWLPNGIAIDNRQLLNLIGKCKSSINGSLQKMGYSAVHGRGETSAPLTDAIPMLRNNFNELREWTVRFATPPRAQAPPP
jgi:hypothetical protein